jgi:imidazole glycerol-phosphate synthase subunit HisF
MSRIVPVLTIKDGDLVKTTKFTRPKYLGDPINAIKIFNEKMVDEIVLIDISAREPDFSVISDIVSEAFIPITYSGGITKSCQIQRLIELGVDKVALRSLPLRSLNSVKSLITQFGASSILISIDVDNSFFRKKNTVNEKDLKKYLHAVNALSPCEIIIQDVSKDGTRLGLNHDLIRKVLNYKLPNSYMFIGGASSSADINDCFRFGADAVGVGSLVVFAPGSQGVLINYPFSEER